MAFNASKVSVVKLDNAAGALQTISTYCSSCSPSWELGEYSAAPLGSTAKVYVPGFFEGTVDIEGYQDPTINTHLADLFAAFQAGSLVSCSWEFGPRGDTSGYQKITAELVMTSYEFPAEEDSLTTWSASFRVTGSPSYTTW